MAESGSVILGTAGHIDHGKTALVRALTGVDTDRLKEEKARGITIELGFAELVSEGRPHFGVVDVPGHEAFVRAMVAGAAGMDVLLLVVASDEGVMPQTREHLAIAELLAVPELVVALTKSDLVESEWLELVDAEVEETLADTPYGAARRIPTSAAEGTGLDDLLDALAAAAGRVRTRARDDLTRLPLDRVFTIQGTGTVVTGTMWSGSVKTADRVRILPDDLEARVRGVQVHGRAVDEAGPGDRTALALSGEGADRDVVARGATLVTSKAWEPSRMLTAHVQLLAGPGWSLAHNQRVHLHLGTAEVLARCALLEEADIEPGESGWVQFRLEEPIVARARDRLVIRAYSPVTTIGGGVVSEAQPPKRNRLDSETRLLLERVATAEGPESVEAYLEIAGWAGAELEALPIHVGLSPSVVEEALAVLGGADARAGTGSRVRRESRAAAESRVDTGPPAAPRALLTQRRGFAQSVRERAERLIEEEVDRGHTADPLRAALSLAPLRAALPKWAPGELAEAVIAGLVSEGRLESVDGGVRRPGHVPTLNADQTAASAELERVLTESGLGPPLIEELPESLRERSDLWSLVRRLEELGVVTPVADGLYVSSSELEDAARRVRHELGGRAGLGPSDFREVLPVTRKHLIPLLNFFDGQGTTIRSGEGREVPPTG